MMRFPPVPRPRGWQAQVLGKGRIWLRQPEHRDAERPRDLWSPFREHLAAGFQDLCGYTAMWTPNGTVDHFVPWTAVRGTRRAHLAYQWSNLRYAVGWFNSARQAAEIPDPFAVDDAWFDLLLPSLELVATEHVPTAEAARVAEVLRWLGRDPRVVKVRRGYFERYRRGQLALEGLDAWAPLLGRALRKNPDFLLSADQLRHHMGLL